MARMRSLKPEFFADQDLAEDLPGPEGRDARLLYTGLWGLADEHGRLRGDARWVKGELFAYDDDLTAEVVDRLIDMIEKSGRAVRYRVRASVYLFLPKLAQHQRLEPSKVPSRLPGPDDEQAKLVRANSSENFPDDPAPDANKLPLKHVAGSREQGACSRQQTRGARAARSAERGADEPPPDTEPGEAERILANWISSLTKEPQRRIVNDIGKHIRAALADGQDPGDIREALTLWQRKGNLGPAVLPSLIHQVANAPPQGTGLALPPARASPQRTSTTDARMAAGAALAAELKALEDGQ